MLRRRSGEIFNREDCFGNASLPLITIRISDSGLEGLNMLRLISFGDIILDRSLHKVERLIKVECPIKGIAYLNSFRRSISSLIYPSLYYTYDELLNS